VRPYVVHSSRNGSVGVGLGEIVGVDVGDEIDVGVPVGVSDGVGVTVDEADGLDVGVGVAASSCDRSSAQPTSTMTNAQIRARRATGIRRAT